VENGLGATRANRDYANVRSWLDRRGARGWIDRGWGRVREEYFGQHDPRNCGGGGKWLAWGARQSGDVGNVADRAGVRVAWSVRVPQGHTDRNEQNRRKSSP
jgi:hypothetical protein